MNLSELIIATPEIVLLTLICVVLLADLFIPDDKREITFWLSVASILVTLVSIAATAPETRTLIFYGSYVADGLGQVLKLVATGIVGVVFLYARDYLQQNGLMRGEFFVLGLFGLLGMLIMISGHSMLTMYLGLETLSLSLYALVAYDRDSSSAAESAMKYFILGAIASGALLYGVSWIYGVTGSLQFDEIAAALAADPSLNDVPLWFGLAFVVVGIAFKFGGVPFHMWLPDVYQGARSPVTLYVASAPKIAALALAIRILTEALGGLHEVWQGMIMVVAVLSILIGSIVAIAQSNIKRMLGYSTIAHVGFILIAVFTGTRDGYAAALFYTLAYEVMVLGAFGIVILLSREGFEAENIADFKGLNARSPWYAMMMLFVMFGMAGVPPWIGFFAKLNVINVVLQAGFPGLAVLMVVASVIAAYYYLRVVWYMYFETPEDRSVFQSRADTRAVLSVNGLSILVLGITPGWLLHLCLEVVRQV